MSYGRRRALDDVSLSVAPGEFVCVIGPNGSGKSTLLKVLCGELKPDSGVAGFDGRPVPELSSAELATRRAVLPQKTALSFPFTVDEVVAMGRFPHRAAGEVDTDSAAREFALDSAGVRHLRERMFPTLSGGERQRVHLARVLAQAFGASGEPLHVLLDEPTSALDVSHAYAVLNCVRRFKERGSAVVAVVHDVNAAAQFADRLVAICGGRVVANGTPSDVLSAEFLAEHFHVEAEIQSTADGRPVVVPLRSLLYEPQRR